MRKHCIILSFLLMQSCIHCYVVNPTPERYGIINLPNQQTDDTNRYDWEDAYMSAPEQARQNAWLKYLSEEFKRALNEDTTDSQAQPEMYMQVQNDMMPRDANMDMDHTKVKKSPRMDMQRFPTEYPQSFNYISKQVDVRAPETVYVTFPEHTQIVDQFGRVISPTTTYIQAPQRYMQENDQQMTEQPEMSEESNKTEKTKNKENKKVAHKKSQEKHEITSTTEQNYTEEKYMDQEQKSTDRKTKTKHDKKDKRKKQSKTKHAQETETETDMKSSEQPTSQDKHTDTKHAEEKEEMIQGLNSQNQAKYKTPIESTQNILLAKLNGPFAFGKNAI